MREPEFFRYFLCCRPDSRTRAELALAAARAKQQFRPDLYHLTWFVIAEVPERDVSLRDRVEGALAGLPLHSVRIPLGLVTGGDFGAAVKTMGPQPALQDAYQALERPLTKCDLPPLHRTSGFRPHVTLGHARCRFASFTIALEWIPDRLLLIESEVGLTKHNVIAEWPLLAPRQGVLPFTGSPPTMSPFRLAG
jgi:2'-5' RNA ligase